MLKVYLLGQVKVTNNSINPMLPLTKNLQKLLGYLCLYRGEWHTRQTIASTLWSYQDDDHARASLNTALWQLRKIIESEANLRGKYLPTTHSDEIILQCNEDFWLDVAEFEDCIQDNASLPTQQIDKETIVRLEKCLQLYRGNLLQGFYDDWIIAEQNRIEQLFVRGQSKLLSYFSLHSAVDAAIACGQQILRHDPLCEDIHYELMLLYYRAGQRTKALLQYLLCKRFLTEEFGELAKPNAEMQRLYEKILNSPDCPNNSNAYLEVFSSSNEPWRDVPLSQALQHLSQALAVFEGAEQQLLRALHEVDSAASE